MKLKKVKVLTLSLLQQYEIVDYGDTKVAFIGISAPESIS